VLIPTAILKRAVTVSSGFSSFTYTSKFDPIGVNGSSASSLTLSELIANSPMFLSSSSRVAFVPVQSQ